MALRGHQGSIGRNRPDEYTLANDENAARHPDRQPSLGSAAGFGGGHCFVVAADLALSLRNSAMFIMHEPGGLLPLDPAIHLGHDSPLLDSQGN
jgi:hypothetical protein